MEKRVLIARWLGSDTQPIPIYDEASVSSARQRVREAGHRLNLGKEFVESVTLIASELTHNQLFHARQGYFAVKPVERQGVKGLGSTDNANPALPNPPLPTPSTNAGRVDFNKIEGTLSRLQPRAGRGRTDRGHPFSGPTVRERVTEPGRAGFLGG